MKPASAFVIQQPLLCVCLSFSVVSLIWCCLSLEERHTPRYSVPVSPQCPSVCQPCHVWCSRAQRSPASTHKCSGAEMLATTWGVSRATSSAFSCRCVVPGYRTSRSDYTRGQSRVDCRGVPEVCVGGKAYHYRISFEMVTASVVDLLSIQRAGCHSEASAPRARLL